MWIPDGVLVSTFPVTSREECGILIGNGNSVTRIVKVANRAEEDTEFLICQCDVQRAADSLGPEEEVLGFIHTHLEHHPSNPSDVDFDGAEIYPEWQHCVYKPSTGEIVWYGLAEVGVV